MSRRLFVSIARRLMRRPAAPFHEDAVIAEVTAICREHRLDVRRDRFGNLLVEHKRGRGLRPMVLVAHLDHPGFDIVDPSPRGQWRAKFLGGVPPPYFRAGTRIRFLPQNVGGRLGASTEPAESMSFVLRPEAALEGAPRFAVWELEDFAVRSGYIHGRACDDLIGVAAILTTLIEVSRSRRSCRLIGAITRAEEIGFGGALALSTSRAIPRDALVISLETSRELPPVRMGEGVIVRVGDRSSTFDRHATRFLAELGADLARADRRFKFQRALMSGGSCEGTVFAEAGFQTGAVCVALGNYHNCGPCGRIAAEFVNLSDSLTMVRLLTAAALELASFTRYTGRLGRRLKRLAEASGDRLRRTARKREAGA